MINYKLLDESLNYYEYNDYQIIETPWTVSEYVDNITKPADRKSFQLKHNDKCLVASGEQSFLYLYLKDFLTKGRYQSITPCYRFESFYFLHTKYFMKNELIITDKVDKDNLEEMVDVALNFYYRYLSKSKLSTIVTETGFDILFNNIELGSYGIRSCDFLDWIYGTGCAEPRLSKIISLANK
jgi:hypothetical protein